MSRGDPNRNLVAALSYFLIFITGIVILLVEKEDKFIRFHAMQSTLIFGSLFVLNILLDFIFKPVDFLGFVTTILDTAITIVGIIVWVVSIIKAFQGQVFKWPFFGKIAESKVS